MVFLTSQVMTIIVDAGRWQLNNSLVRTGDAARFISMAK